MSDKSDIEWTDSTWNCVSGCTKVSQGCKHCFAERLWPRLSAPGQPYAGRRFVDVQCHPERLELPLHWQRPRRIFVNSMSDLFHDAVPDTFIDQVFAVMACAHWHVFQILTKRAARMQEYLTGHARAGTPVWFAGQTIKMPRGRHKPNPPWPLPNVWLGVSVEDQVTANERIPILLETPAAVRVVSAEPLLERIGFAQLFPSARGLRNDRFWIIIGSESGPKARWYCLDWFRDVIAQCRTAGVPVFVKQLTTIHGRKIPYETYNDLKVREWPKP